MTNDTYNILDFQVTLPNKIGVTKQLLDIVCPILRLGLPRTIVTIKEENIGFEWYIEEYDWFLKVITNESDDKETVDYSFTFSPGNIGNATTSIHEVSLMSEKIKEEIYKVFNLPFPKKNRDNYYSSDDDCISTFERNNYSSDDICISNTFEKDNVLYRSVVLRVPQQPGLLQRIEDMFDKSCNIACNNMYMNIISREKHGGDNSRKLRNVVISNSKVWTCNVEIGILINEKKNIYEIQIISSFSKKSYSSYSPSEISENQYDYYLRIGRYFGKNIVILLSNKIKWILRALEKYKDMDERICKVKFKKLYPDAIPFKYTREYDACMDMYALNNYVLRPGETHLVKTGIAVEIPAGFEGIVRGRSGLANQGILTHTGTVDFEYRGDIGIILTNTTEGAFPIKKGMRLAQFTVKPTWECIMKEVDVLSKTTRGTCGYGSSGLE